jgi:hypothetical protein
MQNCQSFVSLDCLANHISTVSFVVGCVCIHIVRTSVGLTVRSFLCSEDIECSLSQRSSSFSLFGFVLRFRCGNTDDAYVCVCALGYYVDCVGLRHAVHITASIAFLITAPLYPMTGPLP